MKRSRARSTRSPRSARLLPVLAAGLVGAVLPLTTGGGAQADGESSDPSASPSSAPITSTAFSGYANSGYAAPVRIELYEPTIPIPAEPQAEVNLAYSSVKADSSGSRGRASFVWPGDAIGEGSKTILENLGLPLPDAVTAGGYPIQVNSIHPGGPDSDYNEPLPGVLQRTAAGDATTYAQTGYAADGDPENGSGADPEADQPTDGATDPATDPVGALTGLLGGGPGGLLGQLTGGLTGASPTPAPGGSSTGTAPLLPPATAALVDFGGVVSIARSTAGSERVRMHSRSKVSDVNILGGILQVGSVQVDVQTIGDGVDAKTTTSATYGDLSIAGQKFTIGPDGVTAAGQSTPIPGLSTDPAAALNQLGISITVPKAETEVDGLLGTATRQGLRIEIDTKVLRGVLDALPLSMLPDMLPDELGQLKSLLQGAVGARPRLVVILGTATASTETVQPLDLDLGTDTPTDTPSDTPSASPTAAAPAADGDAGAGAGGGAAAAPAASAPLAAAPVALGDSPVVDAPVSTETQNVADSAGLPPLASIPGALLFGGLALAGLAGTYMRRLGLLALGGGGSCPHGLDSGLPDLRKA